MVRLTTGQAGPVTRELSQFQIDWQNQLQLLHWTAQQQEEFVQNTMEEVEKEVEVECKCEGSLDLLEYGHCSAPVEKGVMPWCYVAATADCPDKLHYNNRVISHLACAEEEEEGSAEEPEEEGGSAEHTADFEHLTSLEDDQDTEDMENASSLEMADLADNMTKDDEDDKEEEDVGAEVHCRCSGTPDRLGYGVCSSPVSPPGQPWCYLEPASHHDCPDLGVFNNRLISQAACRDQLSLGDKQNRI